MPFHNGVFSLLNVKKNTYSNKIFASNFGAGVGLSSLSMLSDYHFRKILSNTDIETGFSWDTDIDSFFGPTDTIFQMLSDAPKTLSTINDQMEMTIESVVGPGGITCNSVHSFLKTRDLSPGGIRGPQGVVLLSRLHSGGPIPQIMSLYYSLWFKLDPNLNDRLVFPSVGDGSNYFVLTECKTGDYTDNNSIGDYRFGLTVKKSDTGLYYYIRLDNEANGVGVVIDPVTSNPIVSNVGSGGYYEISTSPGSVELDKWIKLKVWLKRPTNALDAVNGRTWVSITPDGGAETVICNKIGGIQAGAAYLPWTRIYLTNNYSNGYAPIHSWMTKPEIYNGRPFLP